MEKVITSKVYCVGDNVTAFDIMPARFKRSDRLDSNSLAMAAFADLDPNFATKALEGVYKIVVAGKNFGGGGKTIEGPVFALKGAGIQIVVADSFARIFLRNAINNALPIVVCPGITAKVKTNDELKIDLNLSRIVNLTTGEEYSSQPLSETALKIIAEGGLVAYTKKKLAEMTSEISN
ncbi:3-isopropylmalate dehydratase [Neobacillus sp. 114]|uniref:LeuD/DmdB family oxidoreductase small subunit n=1 Tax=Neobacillus sp. 114 TaxID=3048535 RepID=UPI0024C22302|nr:3-isopropylmalate dehydratase [Neobacillus sp. 114]